jgi:molybdate transport system substrate-binding protein
VTNRFARRGTACLAAGGAAALLVLTACSADSGTSAGSSSSAPSGTAPSSASASGPAKVSGTVVVFAAASLQGSFATLGKEFETAHPGTKVEFNFGGSDTLAASITGGAPADVFAAASPKTMKTVTDAGDGSGEPATFVRNQLEIATPPGNPKHIAALKDLTASGLTVVLCAKTVPCGAAAQTALTAANVTVTPASYEQDVKSALTKVELKEADAAIVYRTDVRAADGTVDGVDFPESAKAINTYPIVALKGAPNTAGAQAFIALVESAEGQKVLSQAGFLKP